MAWIFEAQSQADDDVLLLSASPALAAPQLGALQWFSCVKLTSTSPWQRSPTKWTPGSGNTRCIHRRACQSKHPSRHTQTHSGKGYNAARNKRADGWQQCGASLGRVVKKSVFLCVSSHGRAPMLLCFWGRFYCSGVCPIWDKLFQQVCVWFILNVLGAKDLFFFLVNLMSNQQGLDFSSF